MSQAKVDQYKKAKANRKETMAKEKRNRMLTKIGVGAVALVLLGWIGISTAEFIYESRPVNKILCDTKALDDYLNGLYAETE